MGSPKVISLRYEAVCAACAEALPRGTKANWDRAAKTATCEPCLGMPAEAAADVPPAVPVEETPEPIERGVAGASATLEAATRRLRREARVKGRLGRRLGGVVLALSADPPSSAAWAQGGRGETILGERLDGLHDDETVVVLHDRRIPGSRANIDHLAVTRSGIYVIDAKHYRSGVVRIVQRGSFFGRDRRLYVGRRDRTKLVAAMAKQVAAVRGVLGDALPAEFAVPVRPALCFVEAEWKGLGRPFEVDGVWIGRPKKLRELVVAPGQLDPEHVRLLAARVAAALPPA